MGLGGDITTSLARRHSEKATDTGGEAQAGSSNCVALIQSFIHTGYCANHWGDMLGTVPALTEARTMPTTENKR